MDLDGALQNGTSVLTFLTALAAYLQSRHNSGAAKRNADKIDSTNDKIDSTNAKIDDVHGSLNSRLDKALVDREAIGYAKGAAERDKPS